MTKQEYLLHIFWDVTEETLSEVEEVLNWERLYCWVEDTLIHHWGENMPDWVYDELSPQWEQASNILCCQAEYLPELFKHKAFFNQEGYYACTELSDTSIEVWAIPVDDCQE